MGHGISWLSFIPGFFELQQQLAHTWKGLLFGQPLVLQHTLAALFVVLILLVVGIKINLDIKKAGENAIIPEPGVSLRNIVEALLEALYSQAQQIIGPEARRCFPVLATFAMFILFSNLLGLIPGFTPPTDNWNTTFGCSIFIFLYYNYQGLRKNGWQHIAHLANPAGAWWGWFMAPLMLPIEIVSHLVRPFSLGVRLATNMLVDHMVVGTFLGLFPILVPLPFLLLGLLVSIIQTLVFTLLSMVYIALAVEDAHADEHEHATDSAHAHAAA